MTNDKEIVLLTINNKEVSLKTFLETNGTSEILEILLHKLAKENYHLKKQVTLLTEINTLLKSTKKKNKKDY